VNCSRVVATSTTRHTCISLRCFKKLPQFISALPFNSVLFLWCFLCFWTIQPLSLAFPPNYFAFLFYSSLCWFLPFSLFQVFPTSLQRVCPQKEVADKVLCSEGTTHQSRRTLPPLLTNTRHAHTLARSTLTHDRRRRSALNSLAAAARVRHPLVTADSLTRSHKHVNTQH
jgi:hypothetical protein